MGFASSWRRAAAGVLAVGLAASLLWLGGGMERLWWPLWLAPLPLLVFAAGASRSGAAVAAAATWLAGNLAVWHYLHDALHVPTAVVLAIYVVPALPFAVAVLLYRALLRRGAYGWAALAFPATLVAFEYLLSLGSPHGTATSLAYSQVGFLPVLQLASVTGPWGITFVVLFCPAIVATAWHLRATPSRATRIAVIGAVAIAAVLGFGAWRLAQDTSAPRVKVGLVASDPPTSSWLAKPGQPTQALLERYASSAEALAAQGAQVIVLPEKLGVVVDPGTSASDAPFQTIADKTRAVIVVGLVHGAASASYNEARVYLPGAPVLPYHKHHLLPPFEPFEPGTTLTLLPPPLDSWGVQICKDLDFTALSRSYGNAGTAVMLVPAWDFVVDRTWHGHMAIMRGVESGFAIVRAGKLGNLMVSDTRGRILAVVRSDAAPFATLITEVQPRHEPTLYLQLGDWFAWLTLLVLGAATAQLMRSWRRGRVSRT